MLHFFTWQQFLVAAALFTVAWYVVIFLLFFRGKITEAISGRSKNKQPEKLKREWEEELEGDPDNDDDLIGEQALPDGISEVEAHLLSFAPKAQTAAVAKAGHDEDDDRDMKLGILPDVLEELKTIFHILEKENGKAEDFIVLFSLVKAKYPGIRNTPNEDAVNEYIHENLPFEVSDEELDLLWDYPAGQ